MKKFVAILFALALIAAMPLTAFAATGINANEQAVLDLLQGSISIGGGDKTYVIPQAYINSAKNYFMDECDMTTEQKDAIMALINAGASVIQNDAVAQETDDEKFRLADMSKESRSEVLSLGQKACAEVGLNLTYAPKSNKVVITTQNENTPVFESAPVIKVTGEDFALNAGSVCAAVVVVMILGSVVMYGVSKKNGLFV